MPNYPTHARWGWGGAGVVAVAVGAGAFALFGSPVLAVVGAVGAGVATFVGAIYPDVDHHQSIPRRKAVRGFRVLVGLGVVGLSVANWNVLLDVSAGLGAPVPTGVAAAGIAGVGTLLAAALVDPAIGLVTWEHRGWTHSPTVNLVLVGVVVVAVWVVTADLARPARLVAVAVTGSFYLGSLIHLGLDGEILR